MQATFGGVPETTEASELVPQKLEDADLGFGPSRFGRPKAESSVSLLSSLLSSLPSGRSLVTAFAEARTSEMAPGLQWLCVGCVSNVSKALIGNTCGITRAGGASDSVFVFDIGVQACNRCLSEVGRSPAHERRATTMSGFGDAFRGKTLAGDITCALTARRGARTDCRHHRRCYVSLRCRPCLTQGTPAHEKSRILPSRI